MSGLAGQVPERLIVMGRVVAPWGVKGWVKVFPYTAEPGMLRGHAHWWVGRNGEWQDIEILDSAQHDRHLVAQFAGILAPEDAVKYKGCEVALPRAALPENPDGGIYQADLIGLEVVNMQGERLGRVVGLFDNSAHDVLRVRMDGTENRERLIPFVPVVVRGVDVAGGLIRVEWGLDW
jgi:16S rRNA processing protein RimM